MFSSNIVLVVGLIALVILINQLERMRRRRRRLRSRENQLVSGAQCHGPGPHENEGVLFVQVGPRGKKVLFCEHCNRRYQRILADIKDSRSAVEVGS